MRDVAAEREHRGAVRGALALAVLAVPWQASGTGVPPVGPGPLATVVSSNGYRLAVAISPNQAGLVYNTFVVRLTRTGRPVAGTISARFTMTAMPMPSLSLRLRADAPGVYRGRARTLTMPGRWKIRLHVSPRGAAPFDVTIVDRATVGEPP